MSGMIGGGGGISDVADDTTPQLGGDLDLNGKNIDFPTTPNISDCLDEDTMVSDSATMLATQQSIKAYVDAAGSGISNVVEDTTPQLGGDLDMNSKGIDFPTTANVTDCLDEDTMVSDSATMLATQQSIKAYVDTIATAITKTVMTVYNNSGSTITEGKCVYTSGWKAGNEVPTIALARADAAGTMPCIGVADADISNNAEGVIVVLGTKTTFDTSAFVTNDKLYVDAATAGEMTTTKPVAANLVQKVGHVLRDHASLGSMVVSGAFRSNDVPNFTAADKFWYGGTGGVNTEGTIGTEVLGDVVDDATPTLGGDLACDALDLSTDTTTGTKIGTGTTQKLAFWNATPVVQPGHIADPTGGASTSHNITAGGGQTITTTEVNGMLNALGTRINSNADALDAILADLAELGLHAAS